MKTYRLEPTKHPKLFRVMDRDNNWKHYALQTGENEYTYLRGVTIILLEGYAKGAGFENFLARHTQSERDEILKSAGERGDKVHRAIDGILSFEPDAQDLETEAKPGDPIVSTLTREIGIYNRITKDYDRLENDEWDALLAWSHFWNLHQPTLLVSEAPLYSVNGNYAGTADAIMILNKQCMNRYCPCEAMIGKIGLWDWKTSGGIYGSHSAQVAAYTNAENIREYLPKNAVIDYAAILRIGTSHVSTGGYELKVFPRFGIGKEGLERPEDRLKRWKQSLEFALSRFAAAKSISGLDYKPFNPEVDIQEIPDTIKVIINRLVIEAPKAEEKPKKQSDGKSSRVGKSTKRAPKVKTGKQATRGRSRKHGDSQN